MDGRSGVAGAMFDVDRFSHYANSVCWRTLSAN